MNRRRRRPNLFGIILLSLLVLGGAYVDRYIVPYQPQYGVPSPTPTRSPESFITEAQTYFKEGKLIPAISSYKEAISSNPNDPAVYVALAQVQVFAGQYSDAQKSAESAILLNKNNSTAYAVLGWTLGFQENYIEAENNIKQALLLDPNNALAHAYYVEVLVNYYYTPTSPPGTIEKAIDESQVAIRLAPDKLETYRARGIVLEATGNYADAIEQYKQAIEINNRISSLHLSLGINYRASGLYDLAVNEFTNANALNPDDPMPDYYLSRTYTTIGEYGQAMQYAESAVTNNPADTNLHGNLGVLYYYNAYWDKSAAELAYVVNGGFTQDGKPVNAMNLTPDAPRIAEYYYTYGLALARLNRCTEALDIVRTLKERIPANTSAMENATAIVDRCQQNLIETPIPSLPTSTLPAPVSQTATTPVETPVPTP